MKPAVYQYSINVRANTSQAEASIRNVTSSLGGLQGSGGRINISADSSQADSSIRNVTSNLGGLQSQASSVGSAFRSSFPCRRGWRKHFSSSLRSGVGGGFLLRDGAKPTPLEKMLYRVRRTSQMVLRTLDFSNPKRAG